MKPYYQEPFSTVLQGDALTVLKTLPDESVDMCMTSPPYWGLRNYHVDGQLGLEKTYQEYLDHLIEIFTEVKRVVRHTIWVNIADSYAGSGNGSNDYRSDGTSLSANSNKYGEHKPGKTIVPGKSLIGIPERFSIAMTDKLGLIKRNNIIWFKRNCMPESVKDRFTKDFEPVYFYAKNRKYYFEQQFEPQNEDSLLRAMRGWDGSCERDFPNGPQSHINKYFNKTREEIGQLRETGRNKRTVWDIPTESNSDDHYAAYPEKLCEIPILAGCPAQICTKCGKAREKIEERNYPDAKFRTEVDCGERNIGQQQDRPNRLYRAQGGTGKPIPEIIDKGLSDCGCGASFEPGTVLDPFAGTGTTGAVAKRLGRKSVLIELNPKYCQIIEKRISKVPEPLELNI